MVMLPGAIQRCSNSGSSQARYTSRGGAGMVRSTRTTACDAVLADIYSVQSLGKLGAFRVGAGLAEEVVQGVEPLGPERLVPAQPGVGLGERRGAQLADVAAAVH